jgi:ketosteroid isomerase-like protein
MANKMKILIFLFALGVTVSCNMAKRTDDPEVLKKVLSDYFDAIKSKDLDKMKSVTTNDFIIFEDGKIWNNDSLMNFINSFSSFQGSWTFDYMRATIDELSGNIVYESHGEFIINDTTQMELDWVESATFRKARGSWRLDLLHSTVKK